MASKRLVWGWVIAFTSVWLLTSWYLRDTSRAASPPAPTTPATPATPSATANQDQVSQMLTRVEARLKEMTQLHTQLYQTLEKTTAPVTPVASSQPCPTQPPAPTPAPAFAASPSPCPATSSTTSTSTSGSLPWLIIGIPTIARSDNADYLSQTLDHICRQLPTDPKDPLFRQVQVVITKMKSDPHPVFEKAKNHFSQTPCAPYLLFVVNSQPNTPEPILDPGSNNVPGSKVRQQSRDMASLLRSPDIVDKSQYFLLMEDDFRLCKMGLMALQHLLAKAHRYHPNWLVIRVSYGMNGILMHNAGFKDIETFAAYLVQHLKRRPPDHLIVEWYAGETAQSLQYKAGRVHMAYRYNLLEHFGTASTLRDGAMVGFSKCYEVLAAPILFDVDAFKPATCPQDDLWPCPSNSQQQSWLAFDKACTPNC
eukprot:TRINITY_DN4455_c0_g1_i2.p1 TRINITY_DN4455_c0_g1~~TRINITY_DN4455_c0_g1_i2.p1  ORF type:complete len:424 (-),score=68.11 TRINITY_DN4455_c0_g1_i2:169-1440(-)